MEQVASTLETARKTKGLSYNRVTREVIKLLGDFAPVEQTITRYHRPAEAPKHPDLVVLFALFEVYELDAADVLDESTLVTSRAVRDLLKRGCRWIAAA